MRAFHVVFGLAALGLAAAVAGFLALVVPDLLGAQGEHLQGDAALALLIVAPTALVAILFGVAWVGQRRTWRSAPLWTLAAGILAAMHLAVFESWVDSAVAVVAAALSGRLLGFQDGAFSLAVDTATYYAYPADPRFWFSLAMVVGIVAGVGWLAARRGLGREAPAAV